MGMNTAYVSLYTWDWQPIGQVSIDLSRIERRGKIDRSELDDMAQQATRHLLRGTGIQDVHVFIHDGDPATPEQLREAAMQEHRLRGADSVSRGKHRRTRKPGPIVREALKKQDLKK